MVQSQKISVDFNASLLFRRFGYVDFASADDLEKALKFNGKKLMGLEIKLDKARTKENYKENKKGRKPFWFFEPLQWSVQSILPYC